MNKSEGSSNRAARRREAREYKQLESQPMAPNSQFLKMVLESMKNAAIDIYNKTILDIDMFRFFSQIMGRPLKNTQFEGDYFLNMPRDGVAALNYLFGPAVPLATSFVMYFPRLKSGEVESGSFDKVHIIPRKLAEEMCAQWVLNIHKALQEYVHNITDGHPIWKQYANLKPANISEHVIGYNESQSLIMHRKYEDSYKEWCSQSKGFAFSKQRLRGVRNKIAMLESLIRESETNEAGDLRLLTQIPSDFLFLKSFISCRFEAVSDSQAEAGMAAIQASILEWIPSSEGESEGCMLQTRVLDAAELCNAIEYFLNLEEKYVAFSAARFKALGTLRKEKMDAKKVALEPTPAPKMLTTLYAGAQKSASSQRIDEEKVSCDKTPKRRDLVDKNDSQVSASSSTGSEIRTFAGIKLDQQCVGLIRKGGFKQYFYLDLVTLADHEINLDNFSNIPVKFATAQGDTGLKSIGKYQVKCKINGTVHTLDACYELKQKHNADRILVVQIPCDQKDAHECLFVGLIGLPGGLHNGEVLKLDPNKIYEVNGPECSRLNVDLLDQAIATDQSLAKQSSHKI